MTYIERVEFATDRDMYNAGSKDAKMSTKGTNELIAKLEIIQTGIQ